MGQRLTRGHQIEILIGLQPKKIHDLSDHFAVLSRQHNPGFQRITGLENLDDRSQLDGLRTSAQHDGDPGLIQREWFRNAPDINGVCDQTLASPDLATILEQEHHRSPWHSRYFPQLSAATATVSAAAAPTSTPASRPSGLDSVGRDASHIRPSSRLFASPTTKGVSDIHLGVGEVPRYRARGEMQTTEWPVSDLPTFKAGSKKYFRRSRLMPSSAKRSSMTVPTRFHLFASASTCLIHCEAPQWCCA